MAANRAMTTRQIYNLRWNNHTNNMLQIFLEQLANEKLVDVTLSCEGKFLKVHRMVLSACSPYFQELFMYHKEQNPVIILNGLKFGDLKSVVNFMYCGEIEVAESEMDGVLAVAEALEIKGLSDVRESYENRHKKSTTSEDKDFKGGTMETGASGSEACSTERFRRSPLRKKRKFAEGYLHIPDNPIVREDHEVGVNCMLEDSSLPMLMPDEESRRNQPQDIEVKEEIHDSDSEVLRARNEEAEWNWTRESEMSPSPKPSQTVVHQIKGNSSEGIISGNNRISATDIVPTNLPESVSNNAILQSICEKVDSVSPLTLGNTARKTMCSKGRCKIPRPPNAFMVFANEWRRKLALLHHGETNKEISVRLGAMWKELAPEAKETYFAAARRADQEHKIRYPGYIYSPKEARMRKILRQVGLKNSTGGSLMSVTHSDLALRKAVQQVPLERTAEVPVDRRSNNDNTLNN